MMNTTICMICHDKNKANNRLTQVRYLISLLQQETRLATNEQKKAAEEKMKKDPWLRLMCEEHFHCKYGMYCPHMNMGSLNMANEEVAKELVLLSCIDKNKMKSFQRYFQGNYPKAMRFITR